MWQLWEQHKYVDCPYTEDRIKKEEYEKIKEDANDMRKLTAELKRNGDEFDVWYDISNLISTLKQVL